MKQLSIKLSILLLALLTTTNGLYAQKKWKGDGNVVKEKRTVDAFEQLELSGVFNVQLSQGDTEEVIVETDQNLQELVETINENGKLIIKSKKGINKQKSTKMNVYVTFININYLEIGGVGNINTENLLVLNDLNLEISGVGNTSLKLDCDVLNAEFSSVGNIELIGKVETAVVENSGVGNLNALNFEVQNLDLENSGMGNAKVYATNELSIENSGMGNLYYKGNADIKDFETSGMGKVKRIDD